jgi:RsiW-degrading membrane proteinase PrsW (M82 family)
MGYYIGLAKFHKEKENSLIFKGVFFAIFLHGLYNFLLLTQTILALLVIILLIILGFWVRKKLKKAETQSKQRLKTESSTVEANEKQTKMSSIEHRVNEKNKDSRNGESVKR